MKRILTMVAVMAIGAVALAQPAGATEFTFSSNWGSLANAGSWTPSSGAPPRNGDIGIITNSLIASADGNLFSGSDTAPQEIRVSSSGILVLETDTLADHNIVLDGGAFGGWWNTHTYTNKISVKSGSYLGNGQNEFVTFAGVIQNDGANSGLLRVVNNAAPSTIYLQTSNTWTGGLQIEAGTVLAAATAALGSNTVTVNGGVLRLQYDNPSATIWANTNGAVSVEANHGGTLVLNGGQVASGLFNRTWQIRDKTFYGNIRIRADSIIGAAGTQEYTLLGGLIQDDGVNTGTLIVSNGDSARVYISGTNNTWTGGLRLDSAASACYVSATNGLGSGPVTVNAGTLFIQNSWTIADAAILTINVGGSVNLAAGVNETVAALVINGTTNATYGTWGATGSTPAPSHTNDTYLAGTGILTVTGPPVPPSVDNDGGALNLALGSASLRGNLGNSASTVTIYWGTTDGGNTPSAWATNVVLPNTQVGAFAATASGLANGTLYYYTCYATNAVGPSWATPSTNFTTLVPQSFYVKPGGTGAGANWDDALGSIQTAINAATTPGSFIYLQSGTYSNSASLIVSNLPDVTIQGGYVGNTVGGLPGETSSVPSVITRDSAQNIRIIYGYDSILTLARVTISGGLRNNNGDQGGGLYLNNCAVAMQDCTVVSNVVSYDVVDWTGTCYGGGLYAVGGRLSATNTLFRGNYVTTRANSYGGGAYCTSVALALTNCTFDGNYVQEKNGDVQGGGLYLSGGSASLTACIVSNNWVNKRYLYNADPAGGGMWANNVNPLTIAACTFVTNSILGYNNNTTTKRRGAPLYLTGASLSASLQDCVFSQNGVSTDPAGEIWVDGGAVVMRGCSVAQSVNDGVRVAGGTVATMNCLVAKNGANGVTVSGGAMQMANCTLADNAQYGLNNAGTANIKNTVAWGNGSGGINGATTVTYSDAQGSLLSGAGNLNVDPYFVNEAAGDYHEKSKTGSWHNDMSGWATDTVTSVCIDAGDPGDAVGAEPTPNGGVINMGAYGGTIYASKTYVFVDTMPAVTNLGATVVRRQSAVLWGRLLDAGIESGLCSTWFYYWPNGGATNVVPMGKQTTNAAFSTPLAGLQGGTIYTYQVLASNSAGAAWSTAKNFTTLSGSALGWYVAPDGDGTVGTNWASAFTNMQDGVNECQIAGDAIYVKSGTYSHVAQVTVSNQPGLVIQGGYAGNEVGGLPGGINGLPTVFTRQAAASIRILSASASTVTLSRLTFSGGLRNNNGDQGGGLYLTNCAVTFLDCAVVSNVVSYEVYDFTGDGYGGGVYATGGRLSATNTLFRGNYVTTKNTAFAGGVYCTNVAVALTNCTFDGNYAQEWNNRVEGGGLWMYGGSATLTACTYVNNWVNKRYPYYNSPAGGALWANNVNPLQLTGCMFATNWIVGANTGQGLLQYSPLRSGAALYLDGGSLTAQVANCVFVRNGYTNDLTTPDVAGSIWLTNGAVALSAGTVTAGYGEGIVVAGGSAAATNWLVAGNASNGVSVTGGSFQGVNCTLANNAGWGLANGSGTVTLKNSIVWGNTAGGVGGTVTATYSDSQGALLAGEGNKNADPLFVAAGAGNYRLLHASPCVDTGLNEAWQLTATDLDGQPRRQGSVDMGAYETSSPKGSAIFFQ
jgi:hypothetical protein